MKNTTIQEYYIVKIDAGNGEWYENTQKYAFIEDVETTFNTNSKGVRVFRRKVIVEEEEIV